eukprot:gnl/TRDRNA2_/TRDRNA2_179913_c0_seq1.p1 gnl/TRDRNA2_/TRDRNA2_179913_c0~~gnl/TRDRNA2_/TRDRNA2_179913_c0_seq1.p1  ORF type:complete len:516 (-),score=82.58 gnl/TRDRNA2_/TRDRNA2_179913_c0_seq1:28-1575(-)
MNICAQIHGAGVVLLTLVLLYDREAPTVGTRSSQCEADVDEEVGQCSSLGDTEEGFALLQGKAALAKTARLAEDSAEAEQSDSVAKEHIESTYRVPFERIAEFLHRGLWEPTNPSHEHRRHRHHGAFTTANELAFALLGVFLVCSLLIIWSQPWRPGFTVPAGEHRGYSWLAAPMLVGFGALVLAAEVAGVVDNFWRKSGELTGSKALAMLILVEPGKLMVALVIDWLVDMKWLRSTSTAGAETVLEASSAASRRPVDAECACRLLPVAVLSVATTVLAPIFAIRRGVGVAWQGAEVVLTSALWCMHFNCWISWHQLSGVMGLLLGVFLVNTCVEEDIAMPGLPAVLVVGSALSTALALVITEGVLKETGSNRPNISRVCVILFSETNCVLAVVITLYLTVMGHEMESIASVFDMQVMAVALAQVLLGIVVPHMLKITDSQAVAMVSATVQAACFLVVPFEHGAQPRLSYSYLVTLVWLMVSLAMFFHPSRDDYLSAEEAMRGRPRWYHAFLRGG